jgi:hypothetical protein
MNLLSRLLPASAILALSVASTGAEAQIVRRGPSAFHRGLFLAPARPIRPTGADHTIFGAIVRYTKSSFVLRLRTGRLINVDATAAISSGRYSAPLYVGKSVVVAGELDGHGILRAQSVTRMTRLDNSTTSDR